jgi:hypothetical protein
MTLNVLAADGVFRVKDGSISSTGWVAQSSTTASAVLSGNRIGFVSFADNRFYVKEGALSSTWVDQYSNVWQVVLSGTRDSKTVRDWGTHPRRTRWTYHSNCAQVPCNEGGIRAP